MTTRKEQSLTIMTFGSSGEQTRTCRTMKLGLLLKDGQTRPITLFVVPLICEPLICQLVSFYQDNVDYLKGLDLVNPSDASSFLDVDFSLALICIGNLSSVRLVVGILDQLPSTQYLAQSCQDQFPPLHQMWLPLALSCTLCVSMGRLNICNSWRIDSSYSGAGVIWNLTH